MIKIVLILLSVFIEIATPAHVCKERNGLRTHPVPAQSMEKIIQTYESPGNEYFEKNLVRLRSIDSLSIEIVIRAIRSSVFIELKKQEKCQTEQSQQHLVWVKASFFEIKLISHVKPF